MTSAHRGAGLAVVAFLALTAAPGASAPADAAPSHVAIVVGGVGTACVPWHAGMTGADVLSAGFTVTYGQQPPYVGFVLTIDGRGTSRPSDNRYWAYFHETGDGWVYSSTGATTYLPRPGTVEGWSYVDGQSPAPDPPAASYASICAGRDPAPTPRPSVSPAKTATARPTPTAHAAVASNSASRRVVPAAPPSSPAGSARRTGGASANRGTPLPVPPSTSAPTSAAAGALSVLPPRTGGAASGIPPWTTAAALALLTALIALAVRRARSARERAP